MENSFLKVPENGGDHATGKSLEIKPLREPEIALYVETGRTAYRDHYCHLWPGGRPEPYLDRNFTEAIVRKEIANSGLLNWLILFGNSAAGVCKLDLVKPCRFAPPGTALFIEKIYFKKESTGRGLGSALISEIIDLARSNNRNYLWLEAMKKGPALDFYKRCGFQILEETQVPYPEVLDTEKSMWVMGLKIK